MPIETKWKSSALGLSATVLLSGCASPAEQDPAPTSSTVTATNGSSTSGTTVAESSSTGATSSVGTSSAGSDTTATSLDGSSGMGTLFDLGDGPDLGGPPDPGEPILWYSIADQLIYIELDPADGSVALLVPHQIINDPALPVPGTGITMLDDGSLLLARGPLADGAGNYQAAPSSIYNAPSPPTTIAGTVELEYLGGMPDNVAVEGLHVDCEGLVYLMDSGTNSASSTGNRLLRFTGDFRNGDLSYEEITDLSMASVADIDDLAPGIDAMGELTDSHGFAIDSGTVYDFDYLTGTGVPLGMAGTYGIHALGGPLFDDGVARLYVLNNDAQLFELDPVTLDSSDVLVTGPDIPMLPDGNSGLGGPLTSCMTGFPPG